jgi:GPH family glycoside/pentoside/hexuronide:cation symporter
MRPLPLPLTIGYSAGQLLDGIVTNSLAIFLLFYVTAVCGLPGGLAGAALSVGLVVDAVMDPLIGSLSDGWRSRLGRRIPFMMLGLPLVAILFVLIFSLPTGLGEGALFAWLALLSVSLRISTSLFLLPYQALGAELSDDYSERSRIVAWRWGIGMLGALTAILLGFGVFFKGPLGLSNRAAYTPFALALALIVIAGGLLSMRCAWATRDRFHLPAQVEGSMLKRFPAEMGEVIRNRSFRILFGGALLFFVALGINLSLGLHANTYFWHLTSGQTQMVTLASFAGLLAGAPLAGPLLARLEKRSVVVIGMIGMMVAQGGPALLRLLGLLPYEAGTLAAILSAVAAIGGALMAAAAIAFGSMMADAADEHEYLFGARREGLYFAGWAFATKAANGGGILIAGLVLQLIRFPAHSAGAADIPPSLPAHTVSALGFCYGPGAALLTGAAVLTTLLYKLDRTAHAAILAALAQRVVARHDAARP